MFLNTPTGRRWQYHPITVADVDESQPGLALVTAHMKCYGNWTTVSLSICMSLLYMFDTL